MWGVSAWAAMFPSWRHQTGSELVVLHGCCLAAVLWAHGPKQLLLSTSSSSWSARTMDGWVTGHGRQARPTPRHRFLPPFRPPLRFLGDWTAPARASGVKPSSRVCCCLLVHRTSSAIEASRTVNAFAKCPLRTKPRVARVLWFICLILFARKCRERRVTIHLRDFTQWNPAITRKHTQNSGVYCRWLSFDDVQKCLHGFYTHKTLHVLVPAP